MIEPLPATRNTQLGGARLLSVAGTTAGAETPRTTSPGEFEIEEPSALRSRRKRAFDVAASVLILVLSLPVWLTAAVIIKLSSPGPIVFRQQRVGVGGRRFTLYKFRTMHDGVTDDAHREYVATLIREEAGRSEAGKVYKLADDRRITGVGRFLRRTSLDELPQLINVLRGDMSLVGPRPPIPYEVADYEAWQLERLTVRPGITGLWQVSGRNRLSYNEMCRLDIQYIRTWSFSRDLAIVARTPWVMLVDAGGAS